MDQWVVNHVGPASTVGDLAIHRPRSHFFYELLEAKKMLQRTIECWYSVAKQVLRE